MIYADVIQISFLKPIVLSCPTIERKIIANSKLTTPILT